jgi:hypothetical protein
MAASTHGPPTAWDGAARIRPGSPDWGHVAASLLGHPSCPETGALRSSPRDGVPPGDAVYHGWWKPNGQAAVIVEDQPSLYRPLPHFIRHSPAGMAWGFDGNGPRDLARSLLADTLGNCVFCTACTGPVSGPNNTRPPWSGSDYAAISATGQPVICSNHCDAGLLPLPYLRFTDQIVAHLPPEIAWSLRRSDILHWLTNPPLQPHEPSGPASPEPAPQCETRARSQHPHPVRARSREQGP